MSPRAWRSFFIALVCFYGFVACVYLLIEGVA
jgi:hypothetical protein